MEKGGEMRCFHIDARDLSDAWFQAVDLCYQQGRDYTITEGSYVGQKRKELDYVTIHIRYPQTIPLLPEIPPGLGIPNPVPEGMGYIERYLPYLMTDEIKEGEQYTYGNRLFGGLDRALTEEERQDPFTRALGDAARKLVPSQVEEVIEKFKRGYANNQACMTIAEPNDIHLPDPPCMRQIDCRIYPETEGSRYKNYPELDEKKLHFFVYFRSWDLWNGMPANLAAITFLQKYMAEEIGVEPGEMVCSSKGLHLYDHVWELARIRLRE
jgi:thymidylate synthase